MVAVPPKLIVGLGNPGDQYAATRHNVGFMVLERLRATIRTSPLEAAATPDCRYWKYRLARRNVWLLEPLTYMNLSGEAVGRISRRLALRPEEVLLVYDDVDLPLGRLRVRTHGASGGHKGVESVATALLSQHFMRLRIGIGRRAERGSTVDHVLSPFETAERPLVEAVMKAAVAALNLIVRRGATEAMNAYNGLDLQRAEENEEYPA